MSPTLVMPSSRSGSSLAACILVDFDVLDDQVLDGLHDIGRIDTTKHAAFERDTLVSRLPCPGLLAARWPGALPRPIL